MGRKEQGKYRRLSGDERERISRWLAKKKKMRWIARRLERSPSTISREIRLGSTNRWTYRAMRANDRARRHAKRRRFGKHKLHMNRQLREYVHQKIRQVQHLLNGSPRKVLNWNTPYETFKNFAGVALNYRNYPN